MSAPYGYGKGPGQGMAPPPGMANCHVCEKSFKVLKRCKSCKSTFYCSRECQIRDWPTHKLHCLPKDRSTKRAVDLHSKADGDSIKIETVNFQTLTLNGETTPSSRKVDDSRLSSKMAYDLPVKEQEIQGSVLQPGEQRASACSTSTAGDIGDLVTVTVKTSKQKHHVTLDRSSTGTDLLADISRTVCIPVQQMKLIHRGKIMNPENIRDTLKEKAVFQAIGEVAENEEGLSGKDITCVMSQIKVDRNTAIKALRQKGNAIDAILYLGNK
ncbi:SET domain-containing protein 14-like [Lytechinus pictus]|uniref:SET domain-containing protein 14-like n=1 Tax=Lytechinus pictus TaxID=7653 RepID=UPI0030B9E88E